MHCLRISQHLEEKKQNKVSDNPSPKQQQQQNKTNKQTNKQTDRGKTVLTKWEQILSVQENNINNKQQQNKTKHTKKTLFCQQHKESKLMLTHYIHDNGSISLAAQSISYITCVSAGVHRV